METSDLTKREKYRIDLRQEVWSINTLSGETQCREYIKMLNVIQHFLTFLLYIVHGPLIVISNSSFTCSMPTSMAY